eukprot:scaffold31086_cov27-Tisochrysis_lutea.AAC.2
MRCLCGSLLHAHERTGGRQQEHVRRGQKLEGGRKPRKMRRRSLFLVPSAVTAAVAQVRVRGRRPPLRSPLVP